MADNGELQMNTGMDAIAVAALLNNNNRRDDYGGYNNHYHHGHHGYSGNNGHQDYGHDFNSLQSSMNVNSILEGIGDIKQEVMQAEGSLQSHISNQGASLTAQINNVHTSTLLGQRDIISNSDRNSFDLQRIIADENEKTRDLIVSNQVAELNRIASERQGEIVALRAKYESESSKHGIEITMVQNQAQGQLQAQAQIDLMSRLSDKICSVQQEARATQQAINIGNTGGGPTRQQANPTNVKA